MVVVCIGIEAGCIQVGIGIGRVVCIGRIGVGDGIEVVARIGEGKEEEIDCFSFHHNVLSGQNRDL